MLDKVDTMPARNGMHIRWGRNRGKVGGDGAWTRRDRKNAQIHKKIGIHDRETANAQQCHTNGS